MLEGKRLETPNIEVPLGTPISREDETVRLHELEGRAVVVTQGPRRGGRVARATEVEEPPGGDQARR